MKRIVSCLLVATFFLAAAVPCLAEEKEPDQTITLTGRMQEEVVAALHRWVPDYITETQMVTDADLTGYTTPGEVREDDLQRALDLTNFARYVAGVDEVKLESGYNELAQYACAVNAANGTLTHTPEKLEEMPDDFYRKGYNGATSSNLALGCTNIADSIRQYLDDNETPSCGHRRWILSPCMGAIGFGKVGKISAALISDGSRPATAGINGGYVAWPAQNTPRMFNVGTRTLMVPYHNVSDITVQAVRASDGRTIQYQEKAQTGPWFRLSDGGYANGAAIIFGGDSFPEDEELNVQIDFTVSTGERIRVNFVSSYLSGDWSYSIDADGRAIADEYYGQTEDIVVPAEMDGFPVFGVVAGSSICEIANEEQVHSLTIEEGVEVIGYKAFGMDSCENLYLPHSLKTIESRGFNLTDFGTIYYSGTKAEWEKISASCKDYITYDRIYYLNEEENSETKPTAKPTATPKPTVKTTPMYRLYNPNSGEHFYTGSIKERDNLSGLGWNYEGVAWNAPTNTGTPVYRMFNPNSGDHHYTMSQQEVENLKDIGWQYEGVCWNSGGNVPQFRLYNPNADCGSHHYTSSEEERDNLVSLGWNYEGLAWYGTLK